VMSAATRMAEALGFVIAVAESEAGSESRSQSA
jgi:hypothetical protein